tara:strand:- start:461 stop:1939 length:1479 start_codon:yes stop_codon:yes gene_type:complete
MPRQLKIIADTNITENAPFRVNWTTPVIVKPGNKIALDKFVAVIPDITTNFALPPSSFDIYIDLDGINNKSFTVTIPGQTFSSVSALLDTMTRYANDGISGYRPDTLPVILGDFNWYRDAGVKVQFSALESKMYFQYVTSYGTGGSYVALNNVELDGDGMDQTQFGFWYPNAPFWDMNQINANVFLLRGGGLLARLAVRFPTAAEAIADDSEFKVGFAEPDLAFRGIGQRADGTLFLINAEDVETNIPGVWIQDAVQVVFDFYQSGGTFQIRIYNPNIDSNANLFDSVADGFETALGDVDYTKSYQFFAQGSKDTNNNDYPQIATTIDITPDINYNAAVNPNSIVRTCALDFSTAPELRAGLNLPNGILLCTPQFSPAGNYTGTGTINMALINIFTDIALEIIDIPLETYQATTSGNPGSRKNIVAYFRPELTQIGSNTYRFDVNIFDWLDVPITFDLNLTSCSFRLVNPATNKDIKFTTCSFNLLINDKEY